MAALEDFDPDLEEAEWSSRMWSARGLGTDAGPAEVSTPQIRIDSPRQPTAAELRPASAIPTTWSGTSWLLTTAIFAIGLGGILFPLSHWGSYPALTSVAWWVLLAGQVALLLGFWLSVTRRDPVRGGAARHGGELRVVSANRSPTDRIEELRQNPSTSFYCHLVEGASPEILLADIQGQLELLQLRLGQVEADGR